MSVNICIHTGYLKEAASEYKRGGGADLLFLTLWVSDEDTGEDVPHKYRVEDSSLIAEYKPLLTPGRAMTVHGKSKLAPVVRHGVTTFETMVFQVRHIVFHHRAGAVRPEVAAESTEDRAEAPAGAATKSPLARVLDEEFSAGVGEASDAPDSSARLHDDRASVAAASAGDTSPKGFGAAVQSRNGVAAGGAGQGDRALPAA
jgi:hypothetical protein